MAVSDVSEVVPSWADPTAAEFGSIRLESYRLPVMPGSLTNTGIGSLLRWSA